MLPGVWAQLRQVLLYLEHRQSWQMLAVLYIHLRLLIFCC